MSSKVTILGINGHIGQHAARAFVAAGFEVSGFGRSNRSGVEGVRFVEGDADSAADLRRAVADADIVVHALNLPYDKWDKGRYEALNARVIAAMGTSGKLLMFPGNVYNFGADQTELRPDTPQHPETPRGAIRVRMERQIEEAVARGDIRAVIIRAGDFYAPDNGMDWYSSAIMTGAKKGGIALPGATGVKHSWAYLPDFGRAFARVAAVRDTLEPFARLHFAGHFTDNDDLFKAIAAAAPFPVRRAPMPLVLFQMLGLVMPLLREVMKMRYLWATPQRLIDPRMDEILGPDYGTPFNVAVAATVAPFFAGMTPETKGRAVAA